MAPGAVACFGGANVDVTWRPSAEVSFGTSNPAGRFMSVGGVAANVSRTLAGLGLAVSVVAKIGRDADGGLVRAALEGRSVNTGFLLPNPNHSTGVYSAVLSPEGDLVLGLADMAIHDSFSPVSLPAEDAFGSDWAAWVLDANLPPETLEEIVRRRPPGTLLVLDSVSRAKAPRLRDIITDADIVFSNDSEITSLMQEEDPESAAAAARRDGVSTVVLPRGPNGVWVFGEDGLRTFDPPDGDITSVTGAGDALLAGTVYALVRGLSMDGAMTFGIRVAAATLASAEPVASAEDLASLARSLDARESVE